jgi:16S rRNA G527 N7-methylase RsmG
VTRMIDIGSGGGSPAIPLATCALIAPPDARSKAKARKSVFFVRRLRALEMSEAEVVTSRVRRSSWPRPPCKRLTNC